MCGIAGFFYNSSDYEVFNNNINSMLSNIAHRGPDNHGTYIDIKNMFAIGHRRLSILDLSDKGNQPMKSFKGNYTITYNGEAYNHNNLRNKLKTEFQFSNWKSNSDTETIVNYMEFYGVEKTIKDIDGMFSIGVWDRKKNRFILARDAFGEKPLYYGWGNKIFYFASEINALIGSIGFINEINPRAISSLMQYSYISAPNSIYNNIYKVKPGQLIEVRPGIQNTTEHEILNYCKISNWFNLKDEIEKTKNTKDNSLPIKNIIEETISSRLISDASLGCFLSGGVDSSLVASVISTISKTKYETFTIGFNEKEFDESRKAKIISDYLGLKSNILILNEKKMLNIVPKINDIYDEPFADSSQVPTFLLSQFASQFSKVSLSGDGGDELFGGYNRYYLTKNIWKFSSYIPFNIRNNFFNFVLNMPPSIFNNFEKIINYVLPDHRKIKLLSEKIKKLSTKILDKKSMEELYISFLTEWNLDEIIINPEPTNYFEKFKKNQIKNLTFEENMMYFDTFTYLPDDILTKVDRASMSVGLEVRSPFLSKKILNLAYSLDINKKISKNNGKIILKEVLKNYLPSNLIDYPKQGFGVPLSSWIRGPLREWVFDNLNSQKIATQQFIKVKDLIKNYEIHCEGKINLSSKLWPAIIFCDWYNRKF